MLTEMIRPRRILELGTFTGYATLCMAEGLAALEKNSEERVSTRSRYSTRMRIFCAMRSDVCQVARG